MTRGTADYSNVKSSGQVSRLLDLGELAARLGSPVTLDRRGDILFFDTFEYGLVRWIPELSGVSATATTTAQVARTGGFSAEVVTGSTLSTYAGLRTVQPLPNLSGIGLMVAWRAVNNTPLFQLQLIAQHAAGNVDVRIRYDNSSNVLQYYNASQAWETFATSILLHSSDRHWQVLKLVADLENAKFKRVILNATEYDLSGIATFEPNSNTPPWLMVNIRITGAAGSTYTVQLDDIIVTQNEP